MTGIRLSDGSTIEAVIEGAGPAVLLPVDPIPVTGDRAAELRKWGVDPALGRRLVDGLSDRFRVVAFDYEGHLAEHPKPDSLTPGNVAFDLLTVADAAGTDRFAYYGYSWLALAGLQLALRTDRLSALVMGGYPPLDGPYEEMLAVTEAGHDQAIAAAERREAAAAADAPEPEPAPTPAPGTGSPDSPDFDPADFDWTSVEITLTEEQTRQYLTLYRELQGFDDRSIQDRLTIPRLCFAGSADTIDYDGSWGGVTVDLAGPLVRERDTLQRLGWQVHVLEGLDHTSAMQPDAVLPIIRPWLSENLL
ncbi:alpha/beta fold hydrolase [Diaminobutyricibacter sp. McL0608]|uniref:alpha/beta fold hydrolase n=1 Tax=Leifsonia sp. McL0608 TaxID=3143537 RepID=UPI0031F31C31